MLCPIRQPAKNYNFNSMKKICSLISLSFIFLLASCGGGKISNDANLTPIQNQAVTYVKKHLEKREHLESYQVVEEPMPASILEQPFLNLRNVVFKAGLDYQSCKTRNLEAGMQMAQNKIDAAQAQILATDSLLTQNLGNQNSIIVLAKVKSPKSHDGQPKSLVVVFDPSTMEVKEWLPVTTPTQNTVALVMCAKNNTLSEYAKEQNHDTSMLASKTDNPVLKFVLEAHPL